MFLFFRSFLALSLMFIFFSCGDSDKSSSPSGSPRASLDEAGDTRCESGLVWDEDEAVKREEWFLAKSAAETAGDSSFAEKEPVVCRPSKTGYFVNDLGEEEACTPVENITAPALDESGNTIADTFNNGDFLPNTGPLAEDSCPFKCQAGYVKDALGRSCSIPPAGMYADADGKARQCNKIIDGDGKDADENALYAPFADNTGPVSGADGCPFTCEDGTRPAPMVVDGETLHPRVCNADGVGVYNKNVKGDIEETPCTPIKYISRWLHPGDTPLTTDICDYDCQAGYLKIAADRECKSPAAGKYTDNGIAEKDCDDDSTLGTPFTIPNGKYKRMVGFPVPDANSCPFDCADGYVKTDEGGIRTCTVPDPGYYADADGDKQTCGSIANSKQVGGDLVTGAGSVTVVTASDKCPFTCETGYKKDETARTCALSKVGYYADANGVETECAKIENGHFLSNQDVAVQCPFACNVGYVKTDNGATQTCTVPADGYFADSNGGEQKCTTEKADIDNVEKIGAINQVGYELSDIALCRFSCNPGFIPDFNNRQCLKLGTGKFVNSLGQEGDCGVKPDSSPGWTETQPVSVTLASKCEFGCAANRTPDAEDEGGTGSGSNCAVDSGHVVLASAGGPAGDKAATACTNGTIPNDAKDACEPPSRGYFAARTNITTDPGIETPCNGTIDTIVDTNGDNIPDHPVTSTGWVTAQVSAVNTAAACAFECAAGARSQDLARTPVGTGITSGSCDVPAGHIVAAGPITSPNPATTCNIVTSNVRQVPNDAQTSCENPSLGYFSAAGVETACDENAVTAGIQLPSGAANWDTPQPSTVLSATECHISRCMDASDQVTASDSKSCRNPTAGKYADTSGVEQDCNAGKYATGSAARSISGCLSCATGKVSAAGAAICGNPGTGQYSASGIETPCASGSVISTDKSSCGHPSAGHYSDSTTRAEVDCAAGTYAAGRASRDGAGSCGGCATGKVSAAGAAICGNPGTGQYSASGIETPCASGSVISTDKSSCGHPTAGHYSHSTTRAEVDCAAGTYGAGRASRDGAGSCGGCATGKVSAAGAAICGNPGTGQYSASGIETPCASGSVISTDKSSCGHPTAGHYSHSTTRAEVDCAAGTYGAGRASRDGAGSCGGCATGKVSAAGSDSARDCVNPSKGYYSNSGVQTACTDSDTQDFDIDPPANAIDWLNVQPAAVISSTPCRISGCQNGKVPNSATPTSCRDPNKGHYSNSGVEAPCTDSNNSKRDGITPPTNAKDWVNAQPVGVTTARACRISGCQNGKVLNATNTACVNPKAGHYSKNGVNTVCSKGTYASRAGARSSCTSCALPTLTIKNGAGPGTSPYYAWTNTGATANTGSSGGCTFNCLRARFSMSSMRSTSTGCRYGPSGDMDF